MTVASDGLPTFGPATSRSTLNRRIFLRMEGLARNGSPIDFLTLREKLSRHGELEAIGDDAYIASLVHGLPDRPSIQHYVRMVSDAAWPKACCKSLREGTAPCN
jgi:replicative DNA helicase